MSLVTKPSRALLLPSFHVNVRRAECASLWRRDTLQSEPLSVFFQGVESEVCFCASAPVHPKQLHCVGAACHPCITSGCWFSLRTPFVLLGLLSFFLLHPTSLFPPFFSLSLFSLSALVSLWKSHCTGLLALFSSMSFPLLVRLPERRSTLVSFSGPSSVISPMTIAFPVLSLGTVYHISPCPVCFSGGCRF